MSETHLQGLQTDAGLGRFASIVDFDDKPAMLRCRGDEDRTTQGSRRQALTRAIRAQTDVVVDLSELVFADPSLMVDLAMLARRLRTAAGRSCCAAPSRRS